MCLTLEAYDHAWHAIACSLGAPLLIYAKPEWRLRSLVAGQKVHVGENPHAQMAIIARILRGTKPAGKAAEAKTQHCYYVLLQVGQEFEYAALQHIHYDPGYTYDTEFQWCEEVAFEGRRVPATWAPKLVHFKPKSVSVVAKAAAHFISTLSGNKRKRSAALQQSAPAVASSDMESNCSQSDSE